MPRLEVRLTLHERCTPTERALALTLLTWVNALREAAGHPALTEADVEAGVRQWLRSDSSPPAPEGAPE
jgi:hypothetical protein